MNPNQPLEISEQAFRAVTSVLALEHSASAQNVNLHHPDFTIALGQQIQLVLNQSRAADMETIAQLSSQILALREALIHWGSHDVNCLSSYGGQACNCGYDKALSSTHAPSVSQRQANES